MCTEFEMKLYQTGTNAAYAEYLKIKSVMPNGGCGLNDDEEAWLCAYLECNPRLNSRLSEAAPALLAALERLAGCYSDSRPPMLWADVSVKEASDAWQTARAAIASARGQS